MLYKVNVGTNQMTIFLSHSFVIKWVGFLGQYIFNQLIDNFCLKRILYIQCFVGRMVIWRAGNCGRIGAIGLRPKLY